MRSFGRIAVGALGMLALVVPASAGAKTATKHHLEMYKAERHVTLDESSSGKYTVSCTNGDLAADGMWRIDEVGPYNAQLADPDEQPWTIASGVQVLGAYPSDTSTYTFRLRNTTSEDAQVKLFVTCLGKNTAADTHSHPIKYSKLNSRHYGPSGPKDFVPSNHDLACGPNRVFVSSGWDVTAGHAVPFSSYPESNLRQWNYGFYVKAPHTKITTYGRCLELRTASAKGHWHKLYAYHVTSPVQHFDKGNHVWEHQLSCGEHQKALVGGWSLFKHGHHWDNHDWHFLGMDPRIKTRAFKTYGVGANGHFSVVCVNDRTSRPLSH
jgi:hypothetical protein